MKNIIKQDGPINCIRWQQTQFHHT